MRENIRHDRTARLGLFSATMLVTGTMVGSGIFIVSAEMSRDVGGAGWLLLLWILTGVITILGGLCYAELAGAMPRVGGQYVYLKEALGPLCGFLYGWSAFTVIQCGSIAAVAVAFAKFLGVLVPGLGTGPEATIFEMPLHISIPLQLPWMPEAVPLFERDIFTISMGQVVATGVIVMLTVVNCLGVAAGAWVQNLFTVAKLLALGLVIVVGLTVALDPDVIRRNWATAFDRALDTDRIRQAETLTGLAPSLAFFLVAAGAMVGSLFSADAWANLTFTSGEVRDPHRTVPRSLVLGTCLVIALYLLCNMAYLAVLPANGDAELAKQLAGQAKGDRAHVEAVYAGSAAQLGISTCGHCGDGGCVATMGQNIDGTGRDGFHIWMRQWHDSDERPADVGHGTRQAVLSGCKALKPPWGSASCFDFASHLVDSSPFFGHLFRATRLCYFRLAAVLRADGCKLDPPEVYQTRIT